MKNCLKHIYSILTNHKDIGTFLGNLVNYMKGNIDFFYILCAIYELNTRSNLYECVFLLVIALSCRVMYQLSEIQFDYLLSNIFLALILPLWIFLDIQLSYGLFLYFIIGFFLSGLSPNKKKVISFKQHSNIFKTIAIFYGSVLIVSYTELDLIQLYILAGSIVCHFILIAIIYHFKIKNKNIIYFTLILGISGKVYFTNELSLINVIYFLIFLTLYAVANFFTKDSKIKETFKVIDDHLVIDLPYINAFKASNFLLMLLSAIYFFTFYEVNFYILACFILSNTLVGFYEILIILYFNPISYYKVLAVCKTCAQVAIPFGFGYSTFLLSHPHCHLPGKDFIQDVTFGRRYNSNIVLQGYLKHRAYHFDCPPLEKKMPDGSIHLDAKAILDWEENQKKK
jgi:hypothetical protein